MSDSPTPGELAYVAYVRVRYGLPEADAALTYTRSIPEERAAWEAAAQAVLEACAVLCPICGAELERCNAEDTRHE